MSAIIKKLPKAEGLVKFEETKLASVSKALGYAMIVVGLRPQNIPKGIEADILVNFLKYQFPTYCLEEVKYAFDSAIARKFPDFDPNCYENFSCEYIGRILSAYETYSWKGSFSSEWVGDVLVDRRDRAKCEELESKFHKFLETNSHDIYPLYFYKILTSEKRCHKPEYNRAFHVQKTIEKTFETMKDRGWTDLYEWDSSSPDST